MVIVIMFVVPMFVMIVVVIIVFAKFYGLDAVRCDHQFATKRGSFN